MKLPRIPGPQREGLEMEHSFSAYVDEGGNAMKRIDYGESYTVGASKSSVDSNRLYSILLDARASAVSENMYDIAEKILANEKDNAKNALDRLWALKKNLQQQDTATVDLLIVYYQNKLDVLRGKEEHLKKVSTDSRSLLEDKRKKDIEIASVKQELEDCTREMERLKEKLHRAETKEQELILIESQLKKELESNENEIVNGLYEIIMSPQEYIGVEDSGDAESAQPENESPAPTKEPSPQTYDYYTHASAKAGDRSVASTPEEEYEKPQQKASNHEPIDTPVEESTDTQQPDEVGTVDQDTTELSADQFHELYRSVESPDVQAFPKSVVKTTGGVVIGEYFYNPKVYKNKRNYVYHSLFLGEQLSLKVASLKHRPDQATYNETVQMVQDAYRRVSGNPHLHFEISTNEIVNEKTLKEVWHYLKERNWEEITRYCKRLKAKIETMGSNYRHMLKEQIDRFPESDAR